MNIAMPTNTTASPITTIISLNLCTSASSCSFCSFSLFTRRLRSPFCCTPHPPSTKAARVRERLDRERGSAKNSADADSQLADPEAAKEPDIQTLCAKAARTYDLTRREEDVLRLLVEGRTAPQIAEELVVSPNTVKTHVRNLYRKLGINRRADLACRLGS